MAKRVLAVFAGLLVWMVIATVAGLILRRSWPEYAAVADAMTFTLPMMFARLAIGAVATVAAGWVTFVVSKRSTLTTVTAGLILLALFIPQHIMLWARFPIWYHLTFLSSLVPLTWLGGRMAARSENGALLQRADGLMRG